MKIETYNAKKTINNKVIFSNVSFTLNSGEVVSITGPSGCGKTTLLNCLGLIQNIDDGKIIINGEDTTGWNEKRRVKFWSGYASFVYQDYGIIEDESVAYNLVLNKRKMQKDDVEEILRKVGLGNRGKEMASVLSGGEKQRLGIARAVYKNSKVLYADEPTASLDTLNRQNVINMLHQCAKRGILVIVATHDNELVKECDKVIEMNKTCCDLKM